MRNAERNTEVTENLVLDGRAAAVESSLGNFHAGVDSAALRSSVVASPLSGQRYDGCYSSPIDAAIGIKNGLLVGGAFWAVAFAIFSVVRYFA